MALSSHPMTYRRPAKTPGDFIARELEELAVAQKPAGRLVNGRLIGDQTEILNNDGENPAHYEVREIGDVIPSHDPDNQFARRENYPQMAQERPYHPYFGEQRKVCDNALNYKPQFVFSDVASAMEGAPVITESGIVLGGNSRAMTLQVVYSKNGDKAKAYRDLLLKKASGFGMIRK